MSLFEEVSSLMLESLTLHKYVATNDRGEDTFSAATVYITPVRFVNEQELMYGEGGRQFRTRGKIVMQPAAGVSIEKKDKFVMDEGEIYRVFEVRKEKDMGGYPYTAVVVT